MSVSDPPTADLDRDWYVLKGRDILGPYSGHAIVEMVRTRTLDPDVRVAPAGAAEWLPLDVLTAQSPTRAATAAAPRPDAAQRHYAGFWIRVAANLIDSLILLIPVAAIMLVFILLIAGGGRSLDEWMNANSVQWNVLTNLLTAVVWITYCVIFTAGRWQATPGKRICNIHVIHESGAPIGYGRAIGRFMSYYIDYLTLYVGFMLAGWTKEKTALHDMICKTRVIYGRPGQTRAQLSAPFD